MGSETVHAEDGYAARALHKAKMRPIEQRDVVSVTEGRLIGQVFPDKRRFPGAIIATEPDPCIHLSVGILGFERIQVLGEVVVIGVIGIHLEPKVQVIGYVCNILSRYAGAPLRRKLGFLTGKILRTGTDRVACLFRGTAGIVEIIEFRIQISYRGA